MFHLKSKWLALLTSALLVGTASTALAQDGAAILNALVKKGVLTSEEAKQVQAEAKKTAPVYVDPGSKSVSKVAVGGRLQIQYAGLGTDIANGVNPASTNHFFLRRIYLTTKASLGPNWTANMTYDFAGSLFDAANIQWKDNDTTVDIGLRKVNLGYEERISGGSLKAIERSGVTRYFVEENNGRRLGAGSYRVGLFADGKAGNFFYGGAVTNPERAVNFSSAAGAGGAGNNSPAFWGNAGYNGAIDTTKFVIGAGVGVLPDQGGKTVGTGNDLTVFSIYTDITAGAFNVAGEFMQADVERGASATRDAKPWGFWVQPSFKATKEIELVFRYSYLDSDKRGVNVSDGVRSSPSGGTMNKLTEMYAGGNWYIIGNDLKLQAGLVYGKSKDTLTGASAEAETIGFRSQMQINF